MKCKVGTKREEWKGAPLPLKKTPDVGWGILRKWETIITVTFPVTLYTASKQVTLLFLFVIASTNLI